ncbi:hypothetical protein QAD02_009159 [Eretmocerus hayati]|uniref:Uncharacterized protein n=1 Tax=Eretmocerus hayati TaxID=131215 RepID=A0ACC2N9Y0_9HYME|nr:hypothetical protein QAD02_009159 [Eretmocerus hayati]
MWRSEFHATAIRENMDDRIQPCDDFYQFACGNYKKNVEGSKNPPVSSLIYDYYDKNINSLKTNLEESVTSDDPETFKKLQMFYNVCMNESHIDTNSESEFRAILRELGDWPVLAGESWNESNFNLMETMLKIDSLGFRPNQLFSIEVDTDAKNSTGYILLLTKPSFGIDQAFLSKSPSVNNTNNPVVDAYLNYMVDVAKILKSNSSDVEKELRESLEFEKGLASISLPRRLERNVTKLYNPTTIAEMEVKYPYIQWFDFFDRLISPTVQLSPSNKVDLHDLKYFEGFMNVSSRYSNRTLANYIFWHLVRNSVPYLSKRIRAASEKLNLELYGSLGKMKRWRHCISIMKEDFSIATSALYVRRNSNENSKKSVIDLFYKVQKSFNETLEEIDWMDDKTRAAAIEKLENMQPLIAFPSEYFDDGILDTYHETMVINPDSLLRSSLSLSSATKRKVYKYLEEKVNRSDWTNYIGGADDVNAFYNPRLNLVDVKAGILQGFVFNEAYPNYINYAGIGFILSHEITHGFDDRGRMGDKDGNTKNWWDVDTEKKYLNKTRCVMDQYRNYSFTVNGESLQQNPQQTIGENIADIGGLKIAYLAYKDWQKESADSHLLPGLEQFTPNQLFWISYANSFCAKYKPNFLKTSIETYVHSLVPHRVNGAVSNRPEFSFDFKCSDQSPMNRANKCNVW